MGGQVGGSSSRSRVQPLIHLNNHFDKQEGIGNTHGLCIVVTTHIIVFLHLDTWAVSAFFILDRQGNRVECDKMYTTTRRSERGLGILFVYK